MNRQSMTSESHIASIDYRATIVVRSFICECDVALEQYRRLKETAYKHLALPCLEYCASIWDPIQSSLIHQLEMVQHRAAQFVLNRPWSKRSCDSVSQMLNTLNWTSLETRRRQSCLVQYYCLNFSNTWCMSLETVYQRIVQVELLEPVILFN